MGNRSNINLVGNTTEGQNVGAGTGVYKGKLVGNILQYKTLSVTGTTMTITSDANNIYFSANTGGGGGSTYWSSGATGLYPSAGEDVVIPSGSHYYFGNGTTGIQGYDAGNIRFRLGGGWIWNITGNQIGRVSSGGGAIRNVSPLNTNATLVPDSNSVTAGIGGTGGDVTLTSASNIGVRVDSLGNAYLPNISGQTTANVVYYDTTAGRLTYGAGGGGGGYWSQSGTTVYPTTTGDCVKTYRAGNCLWLDGFGYIESSNALNLRPESNSGGAGYQTTICGGVGAGGAGGNVVLFGGFSSTNAGGSISICPEIGVGGTGKFIVKNLPAKTSETCALYIHANGCVSTGTVAQSATYTGGVCEYSANNVCLGGALGAGTTTLTLNASAAQQFAIQDTSATCMMFCVGDYGGNPSVQMGECANPYKIIIAPSDTDKIQAGSIDANLESGLRVGTYGAKLQYNNSSTGCIYCFATTTGGHQINLTGGTGCVVGIDASGVLSVCSGGGGGGYWTKTGTNLCPTTTGDDILLPSGDKLAWADGSCLISTTDVLCAKSDSCVVLGAGNNKTVMYDIGGNCGTVIGSGLTSSLLLFNGQGTGAFILSNTTSSCVRYSVPNGWDTVICAGLNTVGLTGGTVYICGGIANSGTLSCGGDVCIRPGTSGPTQPQYGNLYISNVLNTSSAICQLMYESDGRVSRCTSYPSCWTTSGSDICAKGGCQILQAGGKQIKWATGQYLSGAQNATCYDMYVYNTADQYIKMHTCVFSDCIGIQLAAESTHMVDPADKTQGLEFNVNSALGTWNYISSKNRNLQICPAFVSTGNGYNLRLNAGTGSFAGNGGHLYLEPGSNGGSGSNGSVYLCLLPNSVGSCTIKITNNILSYCVDSSDCRLKSNLVAITGASSMLSNICGYSAEFNEISELSGSCRYVMLAQDVEQQLPLAIYDDVFINENTYKRIDYQQLIPVMWNIIKELEARIATLEGQ